MPRVFVLNNYPFEEVWEEVRRKDKPDHHLYGINHFERRGFEIEIIPFKNSNLFQNLNDFYKKSRLFITVGYIYQQW